MVPCDSPAELQQELARVLASKDFERTPALARLLGYLGEQVLAGNLGDLKEVLIGHVLYGRPVDYDSQFDSVVRVNANRLRLKLEDHYRTCPDAACRLTLPKGSYLLQLEAREMRAQVEPATGSEDFGSAVQADAPDSVAHIPPDYEDEPSLLWVDRAAGKPLHLIAFLLAGIAIIAGCFFFWRATRRPATVSAETSWSVRPFARQGGSQQFGTFSPDGNSVAFASTSTGNWTKAIYVQAVDGDEAQKLAEGTRPSWSPDGKRIAFLRLESNGKKKVVLYTLATNSESVLAELEGSAPWLCQNPHLSWGPDGNTIYTSASSGSETACSVVAIDTESRRVRVLTKPVNPTGDLEAAVSPDGRSVAFLRGQGFGNNDIYVADVHGGDARRVTHDNADIIGFAWRGDGKGFVLASNREGGTRRLWQASLAGSTLQALTDGSSAPTFPAISARGQRISFTQFHVTAPLWLAANGKTTEILDNQSQNSAPNVSPDGQMMLYTSNRSGKGELWVSTIDGRASRKFVRDERYETGNGRWSPDGRHVALECRKRGPTHICLADADGGGLNELTSGGSNDILPSWSRDGKFLYFTSNASGQSQIYRRDVVSGTTVAMTEKGGYRAMESWDGTWLYVARGPQGGLVELPTNGNSQTWRAAESKVLLAELGTDTSPDWSACRKGLVYRSNLGEASHPQLMVFNTSTGKSQPLLTLESMSGAADLTMSVLPDGESVLFTVADTHSELNLMVSRSSAIATNAAYREDFSLQASEQ